MIKDSITYIREFLLEFEATGTMFPSSRWAAETLAAPLLLPRQPKRILEIGPGGGVVTKKILKYMIPGDELHICEINARFMELLREMLDHNLDYIRNRERVSFFLGPIQDFPEDKKFDVIVCALPFLNFSLDTVREIFAKLKRISEPGAVMTYYEYIGLRSLGKALSPRQRKERLSALDSFFDKVYSEHNMRRKQVWLNAPPINVYTIDLAA